MKLCDISEAKENFSALIEQVIKGEEILICNAGKPIVKVIPYAPAKTNRRLGCFEGQIKIAADFDEWPDDIAKSLGIKD